MAIHVKMPAEEAADRLAIRELSDAYAHCADRRDSYADLARDYERLSPDEAIGGTSAVGATSPGATISWKGSWPLAGRS
jgi:hypothetical protein